MIGFGKSYNPSGNAKGHIYLSEAFEHGHGPAPISPTRLETEAWKVLAGTSRGVWASRPGVSEDGRIVKLDEKDELVMAPYMGTGVSIMYPLQHRAQSVMLLYRTPILEGIGI